MKIRVLPLQPHCFAFGGFEVQMLSAISATQECGMDVEKLDVWSREGDFQVLHLWGLDIAQRNALVWAKKAGKCVVVTALLPYISLSHLIYYGLSSVCGIVRAKRQMLELIDVLVVVNELQALSAQVLLGCDRSKIRVIPNIIEPQYFLSNIASIQPVTALTNYVLCTGNVCRRKNQVNLAKAAMAEGCPLLIVGDVLEGEQEYGRELQECIMGANVEWIKGLPAGGDRLVAAYAHASIFALPSFGEQQPISALEAAAMGKPLLLGDRSYARQSYFEPANLVNPNSIRSIRKGLKEIFHAPADFCPPASVLDDCTRTRVGEQYKAIYADLLEKASRG